ncbi:Smr/MutS family protein [Chromobacterium sp. IIBBL 290-4]|uniref:Smr/MutS family protein n=1 Tax=Chromobacterium sp. IIBBL 290-4 TaxID=2953890 RepID=UPI0020B67618|nr:Smr/MutS family protein [Chromobacterium sp. IIBBL 290-4]UTH73281.1 Smr/MutS family protein [Chromobacterium sp. IIBBL 290-4]
MKTFKDSLKGLRQTLRQPAPEKAAPPQPAAPEELDFRQLFRDVKPLRTDSRHHHELPKPKPRPRKPSQGPALRASVQQEILQHAIGWFEPPELPHQFARAGMPHATLKRLRQGNWPVCAKLDLHGYDRHQAQDALSLFIHRARQRGQCVKVIHGKGFGSPQGEPVLKKLVRSWLQHHPDVLAFCEAEPGVDGGSLLVLLRRPPAEFQDQG